MTFKDYTGSANDITDSWPDYSDENFNGGGAFGVVDLVLSISGGVAITAVVAFLALSYRYRWLIRMKYVQWRRRHERRDQADLRYDAFVSYAASDRKWIENDLAPNLEPQFKLCIQERDFELGQTIVDNVMQVRLKVAKLTERCLCNNILLCSAWKTAKPVSLF